MATKTTLTTVENRIPVVANLVTIKNKIHDVRSLVEKNGL